MTGSTYKGVMTQYTNGGTGVILEERDLSAEAGYNEWAPRRDVRHFNLGTYDKITADWIDSRLKQRYTEMSEPLTEEEIYLIKQQIADRLL